MEFEGFPYTALESEDFPHIGSEFENYPHTVWEFKDSLSTVWEIEDPNRLGYSTRPSRPEKLLTMIINQDDLTLDMVIDALEHDDQGG